MGYKEFQIGKRIENEEFKKFIVLRSKDTENLYAIKGINFMFCENSVELISLQTDSQGIIQRVSIQTNEITFPNFEIFSNKFISFVECINDVLGKANVVTEDINNMWAGWNFEEEHISLTLTTQNMTSFSKNEPRKFIISWKKYDKPKLW